MRPRHNLPLPPNALLGREREVAAVRALLQEPATRLLTLTGIGGVGKTRLALAAGTDLVDAHDHGVWLVELAQLADPVLVPCAVAAVLGVHEEPNQPLVEALIAYLKEKRLLLVIDNCEHLLTACADLASALLRTCAGLRIMATSREHLGVSRERVHHVPPLRAPDPRRATSPAMLSRYTAVQLFVARAQARQPAFALEAGNAPAVVTICQRLDGIPLAIELAAARVSSLPVSTIAERLDERFGLLTLGPRDALPRQQTLRATMEWSWNLLTDQEQILLRRLAVFAGGWTLAAAEVVCAGDGIGRTAVLDLLDGLVSKSLVHVDRPGEDLMRYRLLETVRQYASERLAEAGELAALRERHLGWCMELARAAKPEMICGEHVTSLERLEHEHDNVRAALGWSLSDSVTAAQGLQLAGALWRFWYTRGYLDEGRAWLEMALTGDQGASAARAEALDGAGVLAFNQGEYERASSLHEESLLLRRSLADAGGIAASLNNLGNVASVRGEYESAVVLYKESLLMRRSLGDKRGVAASLNSLGIVADLRGEYTVAMELHEESLAQWRDLGDRQGIAKSLNNLGIVAKKLGDYRRAAGLYEEGLALQRALRDKYGVAASLNNLAIVAIKQSDYQQAAGLFEESLAIERELGDMKGTAVSLDGLGVAAYRAGDLRRAATLHEEALALCRALGDRHGVTSSLLNLGIVAFVQSEYERAATLLRESLLLGREIGARDLVAEALEGLSWVAAACERPRRAAQLGGAAAALRCDLGVPLKPEILSEHKRAMQTGLNVLGKAGFAAAWAEGRSLPCEDAAALAMERDAPPHQGSEEASAGNLGEVEPSPQPSQ
jgi:predicted ATPase